MEGTAMVRRKIRGAAAGSAGLRSGAGFLSAVGGVVLFSLAGSARGGDFVFGDFENGLDPSLEVVSFNGGPITFNGSVPTDVTRGSNSGSFTNGSGFQQYLRYNNGDKSPAGVLGQLGNYDSIAFDINVPLGDVPSSFFVHEVVINATEFSFSQSGNLRPAGANSDDLKGVGTVTLAWNYVNAFGPATFQQKLAAQMADASEFFQVVLVSNYGNGWDGGAFTIDNLRLTTIADWQSDADGTWTPTASWQEGVAPVGADSTAVFGGVISSPRTITVDAPIQVGAIQFNNSNSYTITGSPINLTVTGLLPTKITVSSGSHTIVAPLTVSQDLVANVTSGASVTLSALQPTTAAITKQGAGTMVVNAVRAGSLNVNAGAVQMISNGGNSGASSVGSLTIAAGATLDLANNDLIVNYSGSSPAAAIRAYLQSGFNAGAWNGTGIASSAAAGDASALTGLGYAEAADAGLHSVDGIGVGSAVVVKYTYYGDSSLDGKVDLGNDFNLFLQGFLHGGASWEQGDYNYDGVVNAADFNLFVNGFKAQGNPLGALDSVIESSALLSGAQKAQLVSLVPEPDTLMLACAAAGAAVMVRHRRRIY
jgi:hypothetical protein